MEIRHAPSDRYAGCSENRARSLNYKFSDHFFFYTVKKVLSQNFFDAEELWVVDEFGRAINMRTLSTSNFPKWNSEWDS